MTTAAEPRSLYPHEVVPEPREDAPLHDWVRYHVARATGYWLRFMVWPIDDTLDRDHEAIPLAIQSAEYALTLYALHKGLAGEEAYRWAAERIPDGGAGEWLWEAGTDLGIPMEVIKAWDRPKQAT